MLNMFLIILKKKKLIAEGKIKKTTSFIHFLIKIKIQLLNKMLMKLVMDSTLSYQMT